MRSIALALISIGMLVGCASSGLTHIPPASYSVQTSKTIPSAFDDFWDLYVAELSKSYFVINNIEKESRIINVSFSSNNPEDYIDCGRSTRTSKHPVTGSRTWTYDSAASSTFAAGKKGTNIEFQIERDASLEGRLNIFMAPKGGSTQLSVNARYVWQIKTTTTQPPYTNVLHRDSTVIHLSSAEGGTHSFPEGDLRCVSKGVLEESLLNLVS